jgi:anti-anti-sigma factor
MLSRLLGGPATRVVLDLERTRFLCSTAVGSIASTYASLKQSGGELVLAGLSADVDRIFLVTRLSTVIRIANDWEEAVSLLQHCSEPAALSSS